MSRKPVPRPVVIHEMYFVVPKDVLDILTEIPRVGFLNMIDAVRILDKREDFVVKSYHYVWSIVERNIRDGLI